MMSYRKQRGISLIVGMIMLVMMTLLVVTSFNISNSQLSIVKNAQLHSELENAANAGIEQTISGTAFMAATAASAPVSVSLFEAASTGTSAQKTAITVVVTPVCAKSRILSNKQARVISTDCIWDPDSGGAYIEGKTSAASESLCSEALWNLNATAASPLDSNVNVQINQGVSVNLSRTVVPAACGS